jgi:hypothetical protein
MSNWRKVLLVTSGLLAGALIVPQGIATAKQAVQEVLVANTPDQPVPVSGNVGVTGNVGITGPVTVDGAVSLKDDRLPFEQRIDLPSSSNSSTSAFYQVPADRRLVVEFISVSISVPSGQTPLVSANANSGDTGFAIPVDLQGVGNGNAFYSGATPVLDYAAAGSFYRVQLERQLPNGGLPSGTAGGFAFISGYTLPV